jgi:hypothetical protein
MHMCLPCHPEKALQSCKQQYHGTWAGLELNQMAWQRKQTGSSNSAVGVQLGSFWLAYDVQ